MAKGSKVQGLSIISRQSHPRGTGRNGRGYGKGSLTTSIDLFGRCHVGWRRGPGGRPTHQPNFIAIGVLSPIADYLVATRFRAEKMGWQPNKKVLSRILMEFGYEKADFNTGLTYL